MDSETSSRFLDDPRFQLIEDSVSDKKSILDRIESILETKERRVRTAAGMDRFKQPLNSIIVADVPVPNAISMPSRVVYGDSGIKGWIKASIDDEVFYIGRYEEGWVVQDETDLIIAEADTSQQCDDFLEDLANPAKPLTAPALEKILRAAGHHTFKLLPAGVETQKKYTARNRNAMGTRDASTTTFQGNGVYKVNITGRNAKTRAEDMVDTTKMSGLRVTDIVVMESESSFVVHNRNIKPLEGRLVWRGTGGQSVKPVVRTPPTAVPTDSNPRKEYRVPKKFYDDHIGRADNPSANPPKSSGAYYKVRLTKEEYDDLLSDADYYADGQGSGDFDPEMNGLLKSAAATLKALRDSGPPSSETVAATPKSGGDGNSEKERQFAVEVDTKAAEIYEKLIAALGKMYHEESSVRRMSGQRSEYIGRSGNKSWVGTFEEALTALTKKIADAKAANSRTLLNQGSFQTVDDAERSISRYKSALTVVNRFEDEAAVQEAIWAKHRWNRAFLVIPDVGMGHVHKSRACSTTYPTTRWVWLPDYSGSDESRIVSDAGERACTICYPSAPVGTLDKPTKIYSKGELSAIDARKQRDEERAQKLAEKISKAATKNGDELVITIRGYKERFKTERSAMMWAVGAFGGYNEPREEELAGIMIVAESIAEKRGVNISDVLQEIQDKGDAKRRVNGYGALTTRLVSGKGKKSVELKHFEHNQLDHGRRGSGNSINEWGYQPVEDAEIDTKTLFERFHEIEEKVRHVIDADYWGMPVDTPITPGMKPKKESRASGSAVSAGRVKPRDQFTPNTHGLVPFTLRQGPKNTRYSYGDFEITKPNWHFDVKEHDAGFILFDTWQGNYIIRTVSANIMGIEGSIGRGSENLSPETLHTVDKGSIDLKDKEPERTAHYTKIAIELTVQMMAATSQYLSNYNLYRGMEVREGSPFLDAKRGDTFAFPLSAFSPSDLTARSFAEMTGDGTPVVLELEEGARVVAGRGWPPFELLSQGEYEVVSVTTRKIPTIRTSYGEPTRIITIRQKRYYDIIEGEWADA